MIKIAVCDDIPYAAEMVKNLLLSHNFVDNSRCHSDCYYHQEVEKVNAGASID